MSIVWLGREELVTNKLDGVIAPLALPTFTETLVTLAPAGRLVAFTDNMVADKENGYPSQSNAKDSRFLFESVKLSTSFVRPFVRDDCVHIGITRNLAFAVPRLS